MREPPLVVACRAGNLEFVQFLLSPDVDLDVNKAENIGRATALHIACQNNHENHFEIVKLLLNVADVNVNAKDGVGRTPLLYACGSKYYASHRHTSSRGVGRGVDVVELILENGGDIDGVDATSNAPLHYAVVGGDEILVNTLIHNMDVEVDAVNNKGETALHVACETLARGSDGIVEILLGAGADPWIADNNGRRPIFLAATKHPRHSRMHRHATNVLKHLLWAVPIHGMDIVTTTNERQETLLVSVIREGFMPVLRTILEFQGSATKIAMFDHLGNNNKKPLHIACENGLVEIAWYLLTEGAGESLDAAEGTDVLMSLRENSHLNIVRALLDIGADVNHKTTLGRTPLYWAFRYEHTEIVKFLVNEGGATIDENTLELSLARDEPDDTLFFLKSGATFTENLIYRLEGRLDRPEDLKDGVGGPFMSVVREIARRQNDAVGDYAKARLAEQRWPIVILQRSLDQRSLGNRAAKKSRAADQPPVLRPGVTEANNPGSTAIARGPWNRGEPGEASWRNVVSFLG